MLVDAAGEMFEEALFDLGLDVALGAFEDNCLKGGIFVEFK